MRAAINGVHSLAAVRFARVMAHERLVRVAQSGADFLDLVGLKAGGRLHNCDYTPSKAVIPIPQSGRRIADHFFYAWPAIVDSRLLLPIGTQIKPPRVLLLDQSDFF